MNEPSVAKELDAYRRKLLNDAAQCELMSEDTGVIRFRNLLRLEAARLRQTARDVDLMCQELGGEAARKTG